MSQKDKGKQSNNIQKFNKCRKLSKENQNVSKYNEANENQDASIGASSSSSLLDG
jgi:hypothetical protein